MFWPRRTEQAVADARAASIRPRRRRRERPPWYAMSFFAPPPPVPVPSERQRKRRRSRPTRVDLSRHLGLALFVVLLLVYLVDFFQLLYRRDVVSLPVTDTPMWTNLSSSNRTLPSPINASLAFQPSPLHSPAPAVSHAVRAPPADASVDVRPDPASSPVDSLPRLPMNRNMHELQVPDNVGRLDLVQVKAYYRKLAHAYLQTFSHGIYRQMYFDILRRRTYALTPPAANKGIQTILFQIIDTKVYMMDPYEVPRNSKPFYRARINQIIWLLSKLVAAGRVRNTEFLVAIHDCVQTVNNNHTYRGAHFQESNPTFTIVSCNFSDNIPFPMWEGTKRRGGGLVDWDDTIAEYRQDNVPWKMKQDRAVFRGGNRPSMFFRNKSDADLHCHDVGRTRLQYLSQQAPDVLDVSIGGTCGGVRSRLKRLEPRDHHRYKYILYAEGNCMWADRTRQQMFGPSTIIKQETPCGQFFEPLMKPFVHYIPTDFFFTDTIDRVKWARQNDDRAQQIVRNANEFGNNFLTLAGIEAYVEVLLDEYTSLLVEPDIKLETGAIEVTNKRV